MKISNSLVTNLEATVDQHYGKLEHTKLTKFIHQWFDRNSEILADTGMLRKPYLRREDTTIVYESVGLTDRQVDNAIANSSAVERSWQVATNPLYISLLMLIRKFEKEDKQREAIKVSMYLGMRLYTALWSKYFPFEPKKEIMDFTVANLSNKFDIKRLGSFAKAFQKLVEVCHDTYHKDLVSDDDKSIVNYLLSLRTRINSFIQNFTSEFMKNWEGGYYLNTDVEEEYEDSGDKKERSSDSELIASRANAFYVGFISHRIDDKMLHHISRETQTAINEINNIVENLKNDEDDSVRFIAQDLLALYIDETRDGELRGVCSKRFVPFAMAQFLKTNTDNPSIISIKKHLDLLLKKYCVRFTETKREATKSAYRKAVLLYITFSIQKFICG